MAKHNYRVKYLREIKRIMADQLQEPSDEFVKFFASQVYTGKMTQAVREKFTQMTRKALKQFINDQINERLKTALASDTVITAEKVPELPAASNGTNGVEPPSGNGVVKTEEETEAFYIIRAILREMVPVKRIVLRDVQSYCGILLDDNNRKPICRLWFNTAQRYIGFFDTAADNTKEERVPITHIDDVYKYADRFKATLARYETKPAANKA